MAHARRARWVVLFTGITLAGWLTCGHAADGPPPGGMVIYQDPATGELTVPPPGQMPPVAQPPAARMQAPVEVPGTTPAGGWKMNVQGRFMHRVDATSHPDATVTTDCVPARGGETE